MTNALLNPTLVEPTVGQLLASVGLSEQFHSSLEKDSDWTMVIKLHALFEAVLSNLIVRALNKQELTQEVAHLSFNDAKAGKVAFARSLGLLDKKEMAFLRGLSELRNRLVHDIKNVGFTVSDYVTQMTEPERKKFKTEFGYAICRLDGGKEEFASLLAVSPALIIYVSSYSCLLELQYRIVGREKDALVSALMSRLAT